MSVFQTIGVVAFGLLAVLGMLFVRRVMIAHRGGTIEMALRLTTVVVGRGWSPGLGRFAGDQLRWYRLFSFSPRPKRVFSRGALQVEGRRDPDEQEQLALPSDWVIVTCVCDDDTIEVSMAEGALTGFLSWIEAGPPGSASNRLAG
jgi:hypothetical protein